MPDEFEMNASYEELVYLTNEESVMGMGAITFVVDLSTQSKQY